ncbi:MAG: CD225/dispanin family protein [Rhodococcus sp.]|uniref:CD225/dispanin family protein n=1 Tax=Rhodococcus TaxID=1827 RepID=UPI0016B6BD71|nr:CD225/dispanin family protein [Rhodococcus sp. (in: high G+C Gram-positive bacteria)]NLV77744.1 CD225/dispanin family protein [Rhodococcus sp. (in: high G+C Gram-positive bacteria)]
MTEYPKYPDDGRGWTPPPGGQVPPNPAYGGYPTYTPPPDNYMVWGIITTVLCCLPFGIISLIQSSRVNNLWGQGQFDEARRAAQSAKTWAIWSVVASLLQYGVIILLVVIAAAMSASNT